MRNFYKIISLISLFLCINVAAWGADITYSFTINAADFVTTSYAANNGAHTSTAKCTTDASVTMDVNWTSNQVMKSSGNMQWQKSNGYIYNSTDLGTIVSVSISSTAGTFTTYYGTTEHPTSGTTAGNGFFTVKVGGATGTTSQITITFKKPDATPSVNSVTVSPSSLSLTTGGATENLTATVNVSGSPTPATTVTWSSSNISVATVSTSGIVTPVGAGTCTITATSTADGSKSGSCVVTVAAPATITLHDADGTSNPSSTFLVGSEYTLPSTAASCVGKAFVGWSTVEIANSPTEPASNFYAKGSTYSSLAASNDFYAAYATAGAGSGPVQTITENFSSSKATTDRYDCGSSLTTSANLTNFDYKWTATGGTVWQNGIKLGTSSASTSISSSDFISSIPELSTFTVKVYAAQWNTDGGSIVVTYNGTSKTSAPSNDAITSTSSTYQAVDFAASTDFEFAKRAGVNEITIASSNKRILIDKIVVEYTSPVFSNYTTSCSHDPITVHLSRNGVVTDQVIEYNAGTYALPSASAESGACTGWAFAGWSTSAYMGTSAPSYETIGEDGTTYYAVYQGSTTDEWTKVTNAGSLAADDVLVLACETGNVVAGAYQSGNKFFATADAVFSGSNITVLPADAQQFTLGGSSGAWTFTNQDGGVLGATAADKINISGNGTTTWAISISGGDATITSTTAEYGAIKYNTTNLRFRNYTSEQTAIQLYKKSTGTSRSLYMTSPACPPQVETPVLGLASGILYRATSPQLTITCATDGATIYYTTDGTTPTTSSSVYSAAIDMSAFTAGSNVTVKAIAVADGKENSEVASETYNILEEQCKRPSFTPKAGTYYTAQDVTISCSTAGATIYYTTDGTDPTDSSTRQVYSTAITVSDIGSTTIKAYAVKAKCGPSSPNTGVFVIAQEHTITYHTPTGVTTPPQETVSSTTLPTGITELCDDWSFAGWYTSQVNSETAGIQPLSGLYHPQADVDLYALYRNDNSGVAVADLVTSASALQAGDKYIIAANTQGTTAGSLSSDYLSSVSTVFPAGYASMSAMGDGTDIFTLGGSTGAWTLTNANGDQLYSSAVKKVNYASEGTGTWTIDIADDGTATITSTDAEKGSLQYNTTNPRFTTYTSSQTQIQLYKMNAGVTHMFAPSCTPCEETVMTLSASNLSLKKDEVVSVTVSSNNTSTIVATSDDPSVATVSVVGSTITIQAKEAGAATITITQAKDKSTNPSKCSIVKTLLVNVKDANISVISVTPKTVTIEYDYPDAAGVVVQEPTTSYDGLIADDIFFSKYYEAASSMKLFAIYNGTEESVDLREIRVRAGSSSWSTSTGQPGYVELRNISKLGTDYGYLLPPFTEIVFWSNNMGTKEPDVTNNTSLRDNISMKINGRTYTYSDMASGSVPNWYCLGDKETYNHLDADGNNQFTFNGNDALILERSTDDGDTWQMIDLVGAGTAAAPNISACTRISTQYTINGVEQALNDAEGWNCIPAGTDIPLSTNRYMLLRKNTVKSGENAVAYNTTDFVTLCSEWEGTPVGGSTDESCYTKSGEFFSEVGKYDFTSAYTQFSTFTPEGVTSNADGSVTITVDDLVDRACDYMNIQVANNSGDVVGSIKYKVPIIVYSSISTNNSLFSSEGSGCAKCDVIITGTGTLTKANDGAQNDQHEVRDMEIYPGGRLIVPSSTNYTVRSLSLRSVDDQVASAQLSGTLHTNMVYLDKRITATRWYWICLPYACSISDVTFSNGDPAVYGTDWWLDYYDGASRAATQTGGHWQPVADATVIQPGVGYIVAVEEWAGHTYRTLRFPMASYDEGSDKQVPVDDYGAGMDIRPNHKGWNLVGNPYLDYYRQSTLNGLLNGAFVLDDDRIHYKYDDATTSVPYITLPVDGGYSEYVQVPISTKDLPPFISYFVQIGGPDPDTDESGLSVNFAASSKGKSSVVSRRDAPSQAEQPVWLSLSLSNASGETDQTTVIYSDLYAPDYEIGADLLKWRGDYYTYYTKPVIASRAADGEMAFMAVPDSFAVKAVGLNYYAARQGNYTISLGDCQNLSCVRQVLLYDAEMQTYTNLLTDDYTFSSSRQNNTSRFYLSAVLDRSIAVPTGMDEMASGVLLSVDDRSIRLSALPENARIWIYDAAGRLVVAESASHYAASFAMPAAGVYTVAVGSAEGKQIIRAIVY